MLKQISFLIPLYLCAQITFAYNGPVIDVHVHAWPSGENGGPEKPKNQLAMKKKRAELIEHNIVLAIASGPEAFLEEWSKDNPESLMLAPIFPCINGQNPVFFQHQCFSTGGNFPDIKWLEEQYRSGKYAGMGELYNQYAGIPFDDPRMDPYYELAERLRIPVGVHTHAAPPLTASQCCPEFRLGNGNPLLLENVLIKYPKLKIFIMHANPLVYPEVIDLLAQFPKVHVDISALQMAYSRKKFHRVLQEYADAGLVGRILFGSDGHDYAESFEAYESAEFLSENQLEGIFCRNAERFLRKKDICDK